MTRPCEQATPNLSADPVQSIYEQSLGFGLAVALLGEAIPGHPPPQFPR